MCDSGDTMSVYRSLYFFVYDSLLLCSVGLVMHEKKVEVASVVDEESLVAGWHHVACLLVVTVADLSCIQASANMFLCATKIDRLLYLRLLSPFAPSPLFRSTHLWHSSLSLESPPHSVVNALRLPPAGVDAFEAVGLVAVEGRRVLLDDRDVLLCRDHLPAYQSATPMRPLL